MNVLPGRTYALQVQWYIEHGVSFKFRRDNSHKMKNVPGNPILRDGRLTFVGPEAKFCHDAIVNEYLTLKVLPEKELKLFKLNIMNFVYRKGIFAQKRPDDKKEKEEEDTTDQDDDKDQDEKTETENLDTLKKKFTEPQ